MNHAEIANILENVYGRKKGEDIPIVQASLKTAADERKIASGEYVPVVHGHIVWKQRTIWISKLEVEGNEIVDKGHHIEDEVPYCSECGKRLCSRTLGRCPSCGAIMGGKAGDHHAE